MTVYYYLARLIIACGLGYITLFLISCATPPTNPTGKSPTTTVTQPPKRIYFPNTGVPIPPQQGQFPIQSAPTPTPTPAQPPATLSQAYGSFADWKNDFLHKASAQYGTQTSQNLFGNASYNTSVVSSDKNQAEFAKAPWQYLDNMVPQNRVEQARQKRREQLAVLDRAESRYGVPASVVTAIWGVESSFGANMGNTDLVNALSSLAYDGRRREFAENQLLAMAELIRRGDVAPYELKGSYAGGMGHTQFIPATWLAQGVDGNNDGKKSPFTPADALTSTANYLANSGWMAGLPAYIEVRLPNGFDYRYIGQKMPLSSWGQLGVQGLEYTLQGNHQAELWLPAGIQGPKLLLTANFDAIKVYNNSSNYALAVATLAERMNGKAGLITDFPRHERMLSRTQIQALQQRLTSLGYDTKGADGVAGTNTRLAFARWQADNGRVPDGFISQNSVSGLIY